MFLDCLDIILSSIEAIIDGIKVDIFYVGDVGISLWEIILGFLVVGIIFGFFLVPRFGSGLQGVGSLYGYNEQRKSSLAKKSYDESYEAYQNKRSRNEFYGRKYNAERGRSNEK